MSARWGKLEDDSLLRMSAHAASWIMALRRRAAWVRVASFASVMTLDATCLHTLALGSTVLQELRITLASSLSSLVTPVSFHVHCFKSMKDRSQTLIP